MLTKKQKKRLKEIKKGYRGLAKMMKRAESGKPIYNKVK